MNIRRYILSASLPVLAIAMPITAFAQVEITDAQTTGINTSTSDNNAAPSDVTITATGTVVVTTGAAVTVDSDNAVINDGSISTLDADDTTGILINGVRTGNITNNSIISLTETVPTDDLVAGADIAVGSGRVGILISGASQFTGNIENSATGQITISGQDSSGIKLAAMSSMTGNINQEGRITVFGERSTGLDIIGDVIGNLAVNGVIVATGEDASAVKVSGDVSGSLKVTSTLNGTGYVAANRNQITTRPTTAGLTLLNDTGSVRQAGSVVQINGNIGQGIHFAELRSDTDVLLSVASVTMTGSAPAILIDGNGTPIAIGRVGQITDPNNADFDADLQYAFVNQGTLIADGLLDDISATTFSLSDATLEGGINNISTMRATAYRSGIDPAATAATPNSHARVILIGGGGIAERINNSGTILAIGLEATASIYADLDNILAPNMIFATAIEIDAGGSLSSITNIGTISAILTARTGEVVAIRDASGTLIEINNSGFLLAQGINSDSENAQATSFNEIAIDVAANTTGVTINQTVVTNPDTNIDTTPTITGDVLLGSGNDVFNIAGGVVDGDIDFGNGNDRIELSNSSIVTGAITDSDGQLDIVITDKSRLNITDPADLNATTLTVDGTSIYSPFINPETGEVSTLMASGAVTFEDGSAIAPRLSTVLSSANATFTIVQAGSLNIDTAISSVRSDQTPFLYNTTFSRDLNDANTLIMTLDVRSAQELGLDVPQEALFSSAFEALQNTGALGSAFVAITEQSAFNAAYNQLLPEFAAASRQFVMANVDGSTGAVASHLDTARRSQEKSGGAWVQEFAYYADRELAGLSEQFRGYGFGITGGFDTAIGPFHTAGLNFGFATTEIEDVLGQDDPLDVLTLQFGTYAGYQSGALGVDIYAGVGYNDFEANRTVNIGTFNQQTVGDWSGTHYNASVKTGYDVSFGKYYMRPAATFSYLSLNEKAYTESGTTGIELAIDKRTVDTGTATATLDFGARFERENSWIAPAIRIGYRNDVISDGVITTGQFANGTTPFSLTAAEFPDSGFLLGVTFATGTNYASFSFDYDGDFRNGFSRHTARLVLRMLF